MDWREVERELAEWFRSNGVDLIYERGETAITCIEDATQIAENYKPVEISLSDLARRLCA